MTDEEKKAQEAETKKKSAQARNEDEQVDQISDMLEGVNPPAGGGGSDEMTAEEEEEQLKKEFGFDEEEEDEEEPIIEDGDEEDFEEDEDDPEPDEEEEDEDPDEEEEEDDPDEEEEPESLEAMRKRIEELSGQLQEAKADKPKVKTPDEDEEEEEEPEVKTPEPANIEDFITDEDLEKLEEDPKYMNKVLKKVYLKAQEDVMANIPGLVQKSANRTITLKNAVDKFYSENPDLGNFKKVVGITANEVESEHPDWDIHKVLDETESRVRKTLNMQKKAKEKEKERSKNKGKKPAMPHKPKGGRGGGKGSNKRKGQKGQIDDLID